MRFWLSTATIVGTIIGVGIFSLPAVAVEAGWMGMVVVSLLVLTVVILTHIAYAHVVVLTKTKARLPGYAAIWLGASGKRWAFVSQAIGLAGSTLVYVLLGGFFLSQLLNFLTPTPAIAGMALFVFAGAVLVWRGTKAIAEIEMIIVIIMVACIVLLALVSYPFMSGAHFASITMQGQPWRFYGVLMFALWGMSVIPQAAEMVDRRKVGAMVALSVVISFAITLFFVFIVLGVDGRDASRDALTGLTEHFGSWVRVLGYSFGVCATFTSYISLTRTTMDMLHYDLRVSQRLAFALAVGVPWLCILFGLNDFVTVMAITGAVSLGIEGSLAMLIEHHASSARADLKIFHIPHWLRISVVLFLSLGISIEILSVLGLLHV